MRRILSAVTALCLCLAATLSQAQQRDLEAIKADGTLRVGVNANLPPLSSYSRTNQLEGFDIDVANAIAERLGVKVQLVPTETSNRVPFLTSGRIDIALGALTNTPERAAVIDFSLPLHTETMSVLTTDKIAATSWQELNSPNITLVNMRGNWSVPVLAEKLPQAKVLLVDSNADSVRALAQGRADALVENIDFFIKFTNNYRRVKWRTLDEPISASECGVGLAKGNDTLREAINTALRDLHQSGFINERWTHWFGGPMTSPVQLPAAA
jgi:polar amino acid transport system substrate-binding protein